MSSISFKEYYNASRRANENVNKNFGGVAPLAKGMEEKQNNYDVENTSQRSSSP